MKKLFYLIVVMALALPVCRLIGSGKVTVAELFSIGIISCLGAFIVAALTRKLQDSRDYKKYLMIHEKWRARFGGAFKRMAMLGIPFMAGIGVGAYKAGAAQYSDSYIVVIALIITMESITGVMLFRPGAFLPAFYSTITIGMIILINFLMLNSSIILYVIGILGGFIVWKNNQIKEYMVRN